jgi:SAM-dependent methyltransferase
VTPTDLPDPTVLLADAHLVCEALADAGWSATSLEDLLGTGYRTHLDRDELAPLLRRTAGTSALARLARALIVGGEVAPGTLPDSWVTGGRAVTRLQAVAHGGREVTVPHDPGSAAAQVHPEQVLGVGAASLTLAAATPRARVGRVLDLGTGAGIQALLAASHAQTVVATDRNPRAVSYTRVAGALNGTEIDARQGDLLEPVASDSFDLIVSNPPFVISPSRRYTYRDAGYDGDEVCRRLVQQIPARLSPGGHAVLLVNWLHLEGRDGDERVQQWFDGTGCDGWVVQRELAAPEDYVTAWLRDTDESAFDALYDPWVEALAGVEAVAFGVVALHKRTDGLAPQVTLAEVDQPTAATWGEEVTAHFQRRALLEGDLLQARLALRADVRLHQVASRTGEGWVVDTQLLQQEAGLRWSGGVDGYGATLLAACDGTQRLGDLLAVLAASAGLTEAEAADQVLPVVRSLVEQGFLSGS